MRAGTKEGVRGGGGLGLELGGKELTTNGERLANWPTLACGRNCSGLSTWGVGCVGLEEVFMRGFYARVQEVLREVLCDGSVTVL